MGAFFIIPHIKTLRPATQTIMRINIGHNGIVKGGSYFDIHKKTNSSTDCFQREANHPALDTGPHFIWHGICLLTLSGGKSALCKHGI